MSEFLSVHTRIMAAAKPEDIFGKMDHGVDRLQTLGALYRKLIRLVHPDHNAHDLARATAAFQKLTALRAEAEERIRKGIYGTDKPTPKPPPADAPARWVDVRGKRYALGQLLATGDVCHVYAGNDDREHRVFKIAQHPADNDLLENEAKALQAISDPTDPNAFGNGVYLCRLADTFLLKSKTQSRRMNVITRATGHRTLAEVARAFPRGLDYRDLAWMFKRTLAALWYVHRTGYVHGAVLPEHILVHPITHGAKLIDLCYAVKAGEKVRAISGPRRASYAPEILAKQAVGPWTDIFMAAKAFRPIFAADSPARIVGFLDACMLAPVSRRPRDAGELHEEFDKLLRKHAGAPAYRRLEMPPEGGAT